MDGFVGFVMPFCGNFAPNYWLFCQGQQLNIRDYQALYAVIGPIYGGDRQTVFNLPDLRGRAVIGTSGAGTSTAGYTVGQTGGTTSFQINQNQLPAHIHLVAATLTPPASSNGGDQEYPHSNVYAVPSLSDPIYSENETARMQSFPGSLSMDLTGGGQAVQSQDPVLAINYIICCYGFYPVRG
jgi:microcystin-dependent protein